MRRVLVLAMFVACVPAFGGNVRDVLSEADMVLWLGDSVTNAGGYVAAVETELRRGGHRVPRIINLGLSSETLSGLTEPDHPFPRPDVHERLTRALDRIEPDVVVACYGMNDGIYAPFSEERFAAFRDGVERLIAKCERAGAKVVLLTPPPFDRDAERVRDALVSADAEEFGFKAVYEDYDSVLAKYAEHVRSLEDRVAAVADVHTGVRTMLASAREDEPELMISADGVHPNPLGHRMIAAAVLGEEAPLSFDGAWSDVFRLVTQRQRLLHDAYLTAVGHKRPRVKPGPPVEEAEAGAAALLDRIEATAPAG